jgi:hypothetical protein
MSMSTPARKPASTPAKGGERFAFKFSTKGIPRVDASMKARLESAARDPAKTRKHYAEITLGRD